jgi:predicted AlkP superfamily phosphohydrolase/phosphomutase
MEAPSPSAPAPARLPRLGVDPESSTCFAVGNGLAVGGIRLNLVGREHAGCLEPGAPAERFSKELSSDLLAVVDADTGRPLVRAVHRTRELWRGPRLEDLPDLLVEWADNGPLANTAVGPRPAAVVRATSPKIGLIEGVNEWGRTGEHRRDGLLAVSRPGIQPGLLDGVDLLDVAPTILALLGTELPDTDGKVVPELVL